MKNVRRTLLALILLTMLGGHAFADGPVVLKFATIEPSKADNVRNVWTPYFEMINKEGGDILKIEIFPGGTLGRNPMHQIKILENGVADMVQIINAYHQTGRLSDDQVTATPFMARDCVECAQAVEYMQEKHVLRGYEDLVVLGQVCLSIYGIHTNFPVKVPADLKGTKMRTAGKLFHALAGGFGATPVAMPVTKVAESMSRGVVDGTFQDWTGMAVFRINDVAKYHLMVPLGTNMLSVAMTKKKYDSLPPKAKALIDKYKGEPFTRFWADRLSVRIKEIVSSIEKNPKHHIYTPNQEEMKLWKAAIEPVVASWSQKINRWGELEKAFEAGLKKARTEEKK